MMLSCKNVTHLVSSGDLERAGLWRRAAVRLHHLMCVHCRRYAAQLRAIGRESRALWRAPTPGHDRESLERLRSRVLDRASSRRPRRSGSGPPEGSSL